MTDSHVIDPEDWVFVRKKLSPHLLWEKVGSNSSTGESVYFITSLEIIAWVVSKPKDMWGHNTRFSNIKFRFTAMAYTFTKEMESWFLLRWS
jgi:hypothetical protein